MTSFVRRRISELLDPRKIELYLRAGGWTPRRETETFSTWSLVIDGDPVHLFVPRSSEPADFEERLQDVVRRLALVERQTPDAMLTNLRYASADLVRVRLLGPRVGPGELPIGDGARLFDGAKDMMLAAACAAIEPRPSYGPRKPTAATDYLNSVRLGQTEPGSYVVTVISELHPPTEPQPALPGMPPLEPFERRVTSRLLSALLATESTAHRVLAGEAEYDDFEETVDDGVSANLCDAIATMGTEDDPTEVEVAVNWAVSHPSTPAVRPIVQFSPGALPVVRNAAKLLRGLGPFEGITVEGFVARLIRGSEDEIGTIVIEGVAMDQRRNVHVELPDEQYGLAIHAHETRQPVRIVGTLVKRGRSWVLSDPGPLMLEP